MATKKTFKGEVGAAATVNPAMQFIDTPEQQPEPEQGQGQPEQHMSLTFAPQRTEPRSKRVQVLLQPSLYERLKEAADRRGASLNELIHKLLEYGIDTLDQSDKGE